MRQIYLAFMGLILISNSAFSQQNLQMTRLNNSCDTLVLKTWVWFSFGYQSTCPQLSHFEIVGSSDTMELKLYYIVSGFWPQAGCERTDTITNVIFSNITVLKGSAYSINGNDTIIVSTMQIPLCSPTAIEPMDNDSFHMIFPNPFSTRLNFQLSDNEQTAIILYDFLGRKILQQTFTNTATVNTEQLKAGIYFYELRNGKGAFKRGKILKQ